MVTYFVDSAEQRGGVEQSLRRMADEVLGADTPAASAVRFVVAVGPFDRAKGLRMGVWALMDVRVSVRICVCVRVRACARQFSVNL